MSEFCKKLIIENDNLFETSFPYSSGKHQIPTDSKSYLEWHFHMIFHPSLQRLKVKNFMVGCEMLTGPQRDITAEEAAKE